MVDAAEHGEKGVATILATVLEFTPSASAARRVAKQNGLRLIVETEGGQEAIVLPEADALRPLAEVVPEKLAQAGVSGAVSLKAGRKVAEVRGL